MGESSKVEKYFVPFWRSFTEIFLEVWGIVFGATELAKAGNTHDQLAHCLLAGSGLSLALKCVEAIAWCTPTTKDDGWVKYGLVPAHKVALFCLTTAVCFLLDYSNAEFWMYVEWIIANYLVLAIGTLEWILN